MPPPETENPGRRKGFLNRYVRPEPAGSVALPARPLVDRAATCAVMNKHIRMLQLHNSAGGNAAMQRAHTHAASAIFFCVKLPERAVCQRFERFVRCNAARRHVAGLRCGAESSVHGPAGRASLPRGGGPDGARGQACLDASGAGRRRAGPRRAGSTWEMMGTGRETPQTQTWARFPAASSMIPHPSGREKFLKVKKFRRCSRLLRR